MSSFFRFHLCRARKLSSTFAVAPVPGLLHRDGNFGTEKNDTAFLTKKGTNKVAPVIARARSPEVDYELSDLHWRGPAQSAGSLQCFTVDRCAVFAIVWV